jgi:hypothetical protein
VPTTTATAEATIIRPETYRLPRPGTSDPHFGFSRSFYYELEKRGHLKLIHIRNVGKSRGVTVIPYEEVASFVRAHMERKDKVASNSEFDAARGNGGGRTGTP